MYLKHIKLPPLFLIVFFYAKENLFQLFLMMTVLGRPSKEKNSLGLLLKWMGGLPNDHFHFFLKKIPGKKPLLNGRGGQIAKLYLFCQAQPKPLLKLGSVCFNLRHPPTPNTHPKSPSLPGN